jgi:8-oxo-dGTP pyrophosphatase MutT (NUDIX family)
VVCNPLTDPPPSPGYPFHQAGCIPVRRAASGAWEVMVVQSRWTPAIWLFPKGGVEAGENGKEAAVRETREEAGVAGLLGPKLGCWRFTKAADQKHKMWLLFVDEVYGDGDRRWKERKKRRREWLLVEQCRRRIGDGLVDQELRRPELMEMLDRAVAVLDGVSGGGEKWRDDVARRGGVVEDEDSDEREAA